MAGLEAIPLLPGRGEKRVKSGSHSLEASSISTAGNAADAALCSTWLPAFTKLTATKMSVYCSPTEQDKPTDGPLHTNRSRGEPSRSGRGMDEGDEGERGDREAEGGRGGAQIVRFRKQLATWSECF